MRRKFVQFASFALVVCLLLSGTAYSAPAEQEDYVGVGAKVMRIGIYYADAGKQSVDLVITTGDGFEFGYYDNSANFIPLEGYAPVAVQKVTVRADESNRFGMVVTDTASGAELCRYDDRGLGTGLAVRPYSLSGQKTVTKCGFAYYGSFRFERFLTNNELMTIVNYVPLDDYVKGVVPYESSASWPMEALRAQAVCARTYALVRINSSHQNVYHFDLCDSTHCQAYKGVYAGSQAYKIEEAVDSTGGVTVRYEDQYCETVYSSSNGGASESNVNVNGKDYPYLIGKEDPFEARIADSIPNYYWSFTFTGKQLQEKLIADNYTGCGLITGIRTTLSPTGNVIALTFLDENGKSYTIYRSRCRTFLSLRSMRYSVYSETGSSVSDPSGSSVELTDTSGNPLDFSGGVAVIDGSGNISTVTGGSIITAEGVQEISTDRTPAGSSGEGGTVSGSVFTFKGTGWGHNVGLSQFGAYSMSMLGYNYRQILEFYYTGVTVG